MSLSSRQVERKSATPNSYRTLRGAKCMAYCQLWLTCKDKAEADKITNTLLVKHLVACVRQMPISSSYWWEGKIEQSEETMLLMESKLENFAKVEAEIAKI